MITKQILIRETITTFLACLVAPLIGQWLLNGSIVDPMAAFYFASGATVALVINSYCLGREL